MKYFLTLLSLFGIAMLITACGAPAATPPALRPDDVQSTAQAAAYTVVAETQIALPTDTPLPATEIPTETAVPTDTPAVLATETSAVPPTLESKPTTQANGGDPCNAPLTSISGGKLANIQIENTTGAPITVSLFLNKTPFGDCGYRGYSIGKGGSIFITDLIQACYNVSVLVNDPKKPTKSFGYGCINNPDKWSFVVYRDKVVLTGK